MKKSTKNKNYIWEGEEEKLKRAMSIPPGKKLQWLYEVNVFTDSVLTDKEKLIRRHLREAS